RIRSSEYNASACGSPEPAATRRASICSSKFILPDTVDPIRRGQVSGWHQPSPCGAERESSRRDNPPFLWLWLHLWPERKQKAHLVLPAHRKCAFPKISPKDLALDPGSGVPQRHIEAKGS